MSEAIKHECGIAFLRLRKPTEFYLAKYGNPVYALQKMSLLMEKQHNRGQDGAGLACVKLNMPPGKPYINRIRSNSSTPIIDAFNQAFAPLHELKTAQSPRYLDLGYLKENIDFTGEVFLG
ncbi:MAG TPA: amidophosphoribosyltransferase, partial [Bacteroidales bacterium]|nr:amidophosphoribosyltransferase [Bacteroidales bacterium]